MDSPDKTVGASLRQNGKHLLITRTALEHQRRQILNARQRASGMPYYKSGSIVAGKGLERQLER